MTDTTAVPGIPFPLTPSAGSDWQVDGGRGTVTVSALPHSDIFVDPGGDDQVNAETQLNAATLLGEVPAGDFTLSARVTVGFAATFDAGVLLLWLNEKHWAKLCFEFSPAREPMVVSVVTREVADDANAFLVAGNSVWLRVSRIGAVYAYHASLDGTAWRLVRIFVLDAPDAVATIGLEAQSPMGEGCAVTFSDIRFSPESLADLRDGS